MLPLLFAALLGGTSGCVAQSRGISAQSSGISAEDRGALEQLAQIAPRDAEIDGETTGVECWLPSESMIDSTQFRLLCRVHYEQAGSSSANSSQRAIEQRYRDVICIGDVSRDPVTEHCYRWAYYSDTPVFDDQRAVLANPASSTTGRWPAGGPLADRAEQSVVHSRKVQQTR